MQNKPEPTASIEIDDANMLKNFETHVKNQYENFKLNGDATQMAACQLWIDAVNDAKNSNNYPVQINIFL